MNNKKIHHLDSTPPLSFLIIKDKEQDTTNNSNNKIDKPIIKSAGQFKKVQITILDNDKNETNNDNIKIIESNDDIIKDYNNNSNNNNNNNNNNNDKDKLCIICNKQFSLYTCPRCHINYCSASCFKLHSNKCSNEFFEKELQENLKNIDKVSPKDSLAFLKRMKEIYDVEDEKFESIISKLNLPKNVTLNQLNQYQEEHQNEYSGDYDHDDENDMDDEIDLNNLNLDEMTEEQLISLLTKEELEEFNKSIRDGTISNLIEEWIPWWNIDIDQFSNIVNLNKKIQEEEEEDVQEKEEEEDKEKKEIKLLLSRIPKIYKQVEPFSKLTNNKPPSKSLYFHLIDIIYCYCLLMRNFNGDWGTENYINDDDDNDSNNNGQDDQDDQDAQDDLLLEGCKLILDLSTVLKTPPSNKEHLKLYQEHLSTLSSIENVIKNLLKSTHNDQIENNNNQGNIYYSLFLLEDVSKILNNNSFILSTLSHLYRSFKKSISILKLNFNNKIYNNNNNNNNNLDNFKKEYQLLSNCFENISKKLLYFLSWIYSSQEDTESFKLLSIQVLKYFENEKSILSSKSKKSKK